MTSPTPSTPAPASARERPQPLPAAGPDLETPELKEFSRTVAHIDWLLVILVLVYHLLQGTTGDSSIAIYGGLIVFAGVIVGLHHLDLVRHRSRRLLAVETWIMIAFITWMIYHTGQLHSPLLNLYLLPIVTSALTLGPKWTLLSFGLIAACYTLVGFATDDTFLSTLSADTFAAELAPMLLVAYMTTMFSSDILNAMAKIKLISQTDELTGIYNVRAFNHIAERDFGLAQRYKRPMSVMMVDSDNLKNVNDNFGHDAGNQLIRHIVHCIRSEMRSTDVVARYGGDEFICLLPETGSAAAALVAERIRQRIATEPARVGDSPVMGSVSIGVATLPDHGATFEALAKNADRALYLSKARGRNRVTVFAAG